MKYYIKETGKLVQVKRHLQAYDRNFCQFWYGHNGPGQMYAVFTGPILASVFDKSGNPIKNIERINQVWNFVDGNDEEIKYCYTE